MSRISPGAKALGNADLSVVLAYLPVFGRQAELQFGSVGGAVGHVTESERAEIVERALLHLEVGLADPARLSVVIADVFAVGCPPDVGLDSEVGAVARGDERGGGVLGLEFAHSPVGDHQGMSVNGEFYRISVHVFFPFLGTPVPVNIIRLQGKKSNKKEHI